MRFAFSRCFAGWVCVTVVMTACAGESLPPRAGVRVIVELVQPSQNRDAVVRHAQQVAGVPVRYAAAVGPESHALQISCANESACQEALSKLRSDAGFYSAELDGVKKKP